MGGRFRAGCSPACWESVEKGTQDLRELLNLGPMNGDDMRRTRLEEGMKELETRMGGPSPLAQPLHQALLGAVFPLSTDQLIWLARENDASAVILSLLSNLPGRQFESLDAVLLALELQNEASAEAPLDPLPHR